MEFNVNDYVRVRLTDLGRKIHRAEFDELNDKFESKMDYTPPNEDKDGWSRWQMHHLMRIFGLELFVGLDVPFEPNIIIEEKPLDTHS